MSIVSGKFPLFVLLVTAATSLSHQPVSAADLVGGYRARPAVAVQRERPRVVRTSYVRRSGLECGLLRVTQWGQSSVVKACHRRLDLTPPYSVPITFYASGRRAF